MANPTANDDRAGAADSAVGPDTVIGFWFDAATAAQWWKKDAAFDAAIRQRFGATLASAARCELFAWRRTALGRLAEVIVLDQFSRNIHRDTAGAFATDPLALALAQTAVDLGADRELTAAERNFLYMPYMHSESLAIHDEARALFERNGVTSTIDFERKHRAIIERFGRYPHRNALLGRPSTPAELEFLAGPGSSF